MKPVKAPSHWKLFCFVLGLSIGFLITVSFKRTSGMQCESMFEDSKILTSAYVDENTTAYNDSVAKRLKRKVRILCWILTSPKTIHTKGRAVKNTWGKRCNKLLFMSSQDDPSYPAINLNVTESRDNLWLKTRAAFKYVYQHHLNDADWFLKADDDTFVIMENLRYLLSKYNPDKPYYFGRWFVPFDGYNSGGAGYVLSKKSVRKFMQSMNNPWNCPQKHFAEDVAMGKCLGAYDIHPSDTRDSSGRQTFHPYALEYHFVPGWIGKDDWLHQYDKYPVETGLRCCSDHSTTFHYVDINNMYLYDYLIHHLYPYGDEHLPHL